MSPFRAELRQVLADRHGPEASAFYGTCLSHAARRVAYLSRTRCHGLLEEADHDEIVAEVVVQLMEGALARFRGESVAELLAFVRTMVDRTAVRRAQRRLRDRDVGGTVLDNDDERWSPRTSAPDELSEDVPSPLDRTDQAYLVDLIRAGSKAELARRAGVSRAAVSQRVARIEARIAGLSLGQREAHGAWLRRAAAGVIGEDRSEDGG